VQKNFGFSPRLRHDAVKIWQAHKTLAHRDFFATL
jgi:hypothetical protein